MSEQRGERRRREERKRSKELERRRGYGKREEQLGVVTKKLIISLLVQEVLGERPGQCGEGELRPEEYVLRDTSP